MNLKELVGPGVTVAEPEDIIERSPDGWDDEVYVSGTTYLFQTNFPRELLSEYLAVFKDLKWGKSRVAMCDEATGWDEAVGRRFPVHSSIGLYLNVDVEHPKFAKYRKLTAEIYALHYPVGARK